MARTSRLRAARRDDVVAVGAPALAVPDEDREQLEDDFIDAVAETFGGQTAYIVAALRKGKKPA